jgi:hypothetical protein
MSTIRNASVFHMPGSLRGALQSQAGRWGTLTRPHRQATPQRREKTAPRAWDLSPKACALLRPESIPVAGPPPSRASQGYAARSKPTARCANAGHAKFAGPEDPSGPGCWTTFLTCPCFLDASDGLSGKTLWDKNQRWPQGNTKPTASVIY